MSNIENIKFFLGDLKASNYNLSFINDVENLIQENKELKTKLQDHICIEAHEQVKQLYIPKSKVKEKIEELEEIVNDFEEYWSKDPRKFKKQKCVDYYKLEALKELLEEGE